MTAGLALAAPLLALSWARHLVFARLEGDDVAVPRIDHGFENDAGVLD
jgi:hypothetical protein